MNNEGGFSGKGESGMGYTRGRSGFETFSHRKVVGFQPPTFDPLIKYPPYHVRHGYTAVRVRFACVDDNVFYSYRAVSS